MKKKKVNDSGLEAQVTLVGAEFEAGSETDTQINEWLGNPTPVPSYCSDAALCVEALEQFEIVPFVLPTRGGKFVEEYVAVFEMGGKLHTTVPFKDENHAAACVLWFVLDAKSRLT